MDDLVITVTVDSSMSYPGNPYMPAIEDTDAVAAEYIRAIDAGASLVHHHGVHHLEEAIASDGKKLSHIDFDGWRDVTDKIRAARDPIMQFGIASARLEAKVRLMGLAPDMMSYAFNVHDEYFRPDPAYPPNEMYSLHPRDELLAFCKAAHEHQVKPEIECFYTGAFWNLEFVRAKGCWTIPCGRRFWSAGRAARGHPPRRTRSYIWCATCPPAAIGTSALWTRPRSGPWWRWLSGWAVTSASDGRTTPTCLTVPWRRQTRNLSKSSFGWPSASAGP